jgi:predicted acylesterase/phospholipase RssA
MDLGEVDYFGGARSPEVTVGELVRIGIALSLFIEAVKVRGHPYVDGGIIDLFPAEHNHRRPDHRPRIRDQCHAPKAISSGRCDRVAGESTGRATSEPPAAARQSPGAGRAKPAPTSETA